MSKEEIENMKKYFNECILKDTIYEKDLTLNNIKIAKEHMKQLETENRKLKIGIDSGLDKDKKNCFYEDGNTGKCLGYSFFNNDEPCIYCQTCEAINIKEDD